MNSVRLDSDKRNSQFSPSLLKEGTPSFSSSKTSSTASSTISSMTVLTTSIICSSYCDQNDDHKTDNVENDGNRCRPLDKKEETFKTRNVTIMEALSLIDRTEDTSSSANFDDSNEEEEGFSDADGSRHTLNSRWSRMSTTSRGSTNNNRTRSSTPPPFSPRVGDVVSPGSVRDRISAIMLQSPHCTSTSKSLQCPSSAPVTASSSPRIRPKSGVSTSSSVRRQKKIFSAIDKGPMPTLVALLHDHHSPEKCSKTDVGDAVVVRGIKYPTSDRIDDLGRPRKSLSPKITNKLKGKWPPIVNDISSKERQRRQREAIYKEMLKNIGHTGNDHVNIVQQRRTLFEQKLKQQQKEQLLVAGQCSRDNQNHKEGRHPVEEQQEKQQQHQKPTQVLTLESQVGNVSENDANDQCTISIFPDDRLFDIVLPSGQRLPPPKGPKKRRRTNYRIRYEGPTLLRLDEVYGPLAEIPEVDDRFDLCQRDRAFLPPSRSRSIDNDSPFMMPRRSRDDACRSGQDTTPKRPSRRGGEDDVFDHDYDDDTSLTEDEFFGMMTIPPIECENGQVPVQDLNSSGQRPDVWITHLTSDDGSCKWKVKRVWDVEDVDDKEPEYEIHQSDLMDSIRELLGVPEDFRTHSQEWDVEIEEIDPFHASEGTDGPPTTSRNAPFIITKIYDIDGDFDGSEDSLSLDTSEFAATMRDIVATADHKETREEYTMPRPSVFTVALEEDHTETKNHDNLVDESTPDTSKQSESLDGNDSIVSLEDLSVAANHAELVDECDSDAPVSCTPKTVQSFKVTGARRKHQKKESKTQRRNCTCTYDDKTKIDAPKCKCCVSSVEKKVVQAKGKRKKSRSFDDKPNYQPKGGWFSPISGSKKKSAEVKSKKAQVEDSCFVQAKKSGKQRKDDADTCESPRRGIPTWEKKATMTPRVQETNEHIKLWWHE